MEEQLLIAISWKMDPFKITHTYVGTKSGIITEAKRSRNHVFKSNEDMFIKCLNWVNIGHVLDDYEDKGQGLFVITSRSFRTKSDARRFVSVVYGKVDLQY